MTSPLPDSRVSGMFRQVVKFYETKQYKKGLKVADQVRRDACGCSVIVAPVLACLLACLLLQASELACALLCALCPSARPRTWGNPHCGPGGLCDG